MSTTEQTIKKEGLVIEALPGDLFKIEFPEGVIAIGYLSGRMRMNHIRVLPGDRVDVEFSPHDITKGRVVRRL